jgi:DNA invertase Pin-like site-specific DNA recombinase
LVSSGLKATEQAIDTRSPEGKLFFTMVAAFGQFETEIRRARQREGIAAAKAKGTKYKGRKPVDTAPILALVAEGVRPTDIARRLGIGRTTIYRAISNCSDGQ